MKKESHTQIGDIGNYYGGLNVRSEDGKFFWSIENYDGDNWDEIPKTLYDSLMEYERTRMEELKKLYIEYVKRNLGQDREVRSFDNWLYIKER